eukprot:CAMPEP_0180762744 /NCGR_PEP_ID=MMETSP1038_2-20121128/37536_1 /TAXON_ID=632150 /ORGANISM="Azadinium spinosum, Strain 3D9" /LENGTH=191 /DNA_ID=CAMNT_0022797031 /DNA_START=54 /DNA_END=627 /DNA_ORIENTATION=-
MARLDLGENASRNVMDGAEVAPDDLDPEALAQSIEELEIQARIRAIEMEVGLLDLRRELEIQEEHVQEWQSELRKNHSTKTGQVHADFENAQRGVEELRKRVQTMEAARPTSRDRAPLPGGPKAKARADPGAVTQQRATLGEGPAAAAPSSRRREALRRDPARGAGGHPPETASTACPAALLLPEEADWDR